MCKLTKRLRFGMSHRSIILRGFSTKKFITTPIYYVNATPHIGHLYSSLIADAIHRWNKLLAPNGLFKLSTGTDEHGSKIQEAALKTNTSVSNYCVEISKKYKNMSDEFGISYTDFVKTSDDLHVATVRTFWARLKSNGFIYSSKYSGWYSVSDETFLPESQLKEICNANGDKILVSIDSGHQVEWTEEENYMFRLNSLQDDLIHWLKTNENFVRPKKFQKILTDMVVQEKLPDISISRPTSRVHWGIKVPEDDTQTIYVWLDALCNYLTVVNYPEVQRGTWPPDVQVIGKDILKFHGIYWPAFLMAANLALPKTILCHSHWTVDGEKMSKSKNNVVCPLSRSKIYTTEGQRYFLLREGVAHSDGNYSDLKAVRILNSELADTLGNLLSRCCSQSLNSNQVFPKINPEAYHEISSMDVTQKVVGHISALPDNCYEHYSEYNFYKAVDATVATLHATNLFFETLKPWELRKSNPEKLNVVLHVTMEVLRICSIILCPIIPNISEQILNKLNVKMNNRTWDSLKVQSWNQPLFVESKLSTGSAVVFRRIIIDKDKDRKRN